MSLDVRKSVGAWYVIRGKEHLKMGSWIDALELSRISETPCNVMSEQWYKQCYKSTD
jgi:hypothetical protein